MNKMISEEERELEDAEVTFRVEEQREAEDNMQILTVLGFTPHYHDKDKEGNDETNFGIQILNMKIGVKFNDKNPAGKVWAYVLTEDKKKDFIKNGDLKQLPLVQRYLDIQAGKKPIPESTVTGRIIERVGKGIKIEIEEDGEKKEIFFGLGAVKRHDDGHHFIPHGFSKPSSDNQEGKMCVPRDILLPEMDTQADKSAEQKSQSELHRKPDEETIRNLHETVFGIPLHAEAQRIREEQGRAPAPTTIPIPTPAETAPEYPPAVKATQTTDSEKVDYYINLIGEITKKVEVEERIAERERGYAISKVFDAITRDTRTTLIAELKNGSSHGE